MSEFIEPHPKDLPRMGMKLDLAKIKDPNEEIDLVNDLWLGEDVTQDMIDAVEPKLWHVIVKQIGVQEKSSGGIIYTQQTIADQEWMIGMCVVVKLGPAVYQGPKFKELGLTPADGPQIGEVYRFAARQPTRYKLYGETFIEVADDALTAKFNREHLAGVSFNR